MRRTSVSCEHDKTHNAFNKHRLLEIRRFFEDYKKNENKQVLVEDFVGAKAAKEAIIKVTSCMTD